MAPLSVPHSTLLQGCMMVGCGHSCSRQYGEAMNTAVHAAQNACAITSQGGHGREQTGSAGAAWKQDEGSTPHNVACGQPVLPHFQVVGVNRHLQAYEAFTSPAGKWMYIVIAPTSLCMFTCNCSQLMQPTYAA